MIDIRVFASDRLSPRLLARCHLKSPLDPVPVPRFIQFPLLPITQQSPVTGKELRRGFHVLRALLQRPVVSHPKAFGYLLGGVAEETHC